MDAIVALLTDDVRLTMPPVALEYAGRSLAARFLTLTALTYWQGPRPRLVTTRANGQPAVGVYVWDPQSRTRYAVGLLVLTLAGERVAAMTLFDPSVLPHFGLRETLPD